MTLDRHALKGFVPAVVTPFAADGAVREADFRELVERLIGFGASAVCVAGDNGESWALTLEERGRLTTLAAEQARGRIPIITGVSAPGAAQTVAYARAVRDAGAAALLLMPQTYVLKATRGELVARYAAVAEAVDLPIVAYNSPRRTGIELGLDDLEALTGVAPIIGIKESHRDFFHLTHLIERFSARMAVMVGPSHYILPGLALGASGFIATGPELLGAEAGRILQLARSSPGEEQARLHFRLTRLYELLMSLGTWPAAFKAALNLQGHPAGAPRDPVQPLQGEALDRLRAALDDLDLLP